MRAHELEPWKNPFWIRKENLRNNDNLYNNIDVWRMVVENIPRGQCERPLDNYRPMNRCACENNGCEYKGGVSLYGMGTNTPQSYRLLLGCHPHNLYETTESRGRGLWCNGRSSRLLLIRPFHSSRWVSLCKTTTRPYQSICHTMRASIIKRYSRGQKYRLEQKNTTVKQEETRYWNIQTVYKGKFIVSVKENMGDVIFEPISGAQYRLFGKVAKEILVKSNQKLSLLILQIKRSTANMSL